MTKRTITEITREARHLLSLGPYEGVAAQRIEECLRLETEFIEALKKTLDASSEIGRGDKWAIIQIIHLMDWEAPRDSG